MTLSRSAEEIASVIKKEIEEYRAELDVSQVGRVLEVGDGIARIYGLANAMAMEMLDFGNDIYGLVFNLEEDSIGAVVLGDFLRIKEGDIVRSTGRLLEVPVGEAVVGRVVNPLGQPLDGKGPVQQDQTRPLEIIAPGIAARQPVKVPLQTGIKAIDSMTPIGRGQRELIIGDRKTGKTAIAIDTIINQKQEDVICIYVAVGQKESTVAGVVQVLEQHGAMDYTTVVAASSSDPAPLQYIAPYAGCAMAEYFMYEHGRSTLVIYDDLTKQAASYRELSLLLRRPPGREAYPGDVFYLHSRLLERAVKMAEKYYLARKDQAEEDETPADGEIYLYDAEPARKALEAREDRDTLEVRRVRKSGGSLTALPIIETQEGEVSAYIPTNVISITDGQIYLLPDLFNAGVRPAVDVGISVSRVGGNAQVKGMKKVAGSLRLDLAAFRELEAFAQLGTELDAASTRQLERGRRMVEVLKQGICRPLHVVDQILIIFAGTQGFLDQVPLSRIREFEDRFLTYIHDQQPDIREAIDRARDVPAETEASLKQVLRDYVKSFLAGTAADPR